MKLYKIDFDPMWPVPCGLVLLAENDEQAKEITERTITHTNLYKIKEIDMSKSGVVFYESGDY